ncbi:hypothetical protein [Brucella pseudogrignonensis]|uniref:Uncharacterized protein n=1 Tax=Brucella pseudogrignonensis TaxID=419475 RepID=A0ABU1M5G2_9HYPH|nr:hypothetical protein [Brucella pseudogrignonensis]MDR6431280.1 hypothetical protein [Brucella pseudogrignonensis]
MTMIQDLHAAISRRDWHAVEVAANRLRDANLEADNAALTARVKELEELVERVDGFAQKYFRHMKNTDQKNEALETQLAATEKALDAIAGYCDQGAEKWRQDHPNLSKLLSHPRVVSDNHKITILCQFARAAIEVKE